MHGPHLQLGYETWNNQFIYNQMIKMCVPFCACKWNFICQRYSMLNLGGKSSPLQYDVTNRHYYSTLLEKPVRLESKPSCQTRKWSLICCRMKGVSSVSKSLSAFKVLGFFLFFFSWLIIGEIILLSQMKVIRGTLKSTIYSRTTNVFKLIVAWRNKRFKNL